MIISACIIDDSLQDALQIQRWLNQNTISDIEFSSVNVLSSMENIPEADLYFLDINMPGMNGFQAAGNILSRYSSSSIIFVSQHDELVYDSLRYNSLFFVRKSHIDMDMADALHKYARQNAFRNQTFSIIQNNRVLTIYLNRIYYFESYRNDTILYTADNEFTFRSTLKEVIKKLPEQLFAQPHRSHLVNLEHTASCSKDALILDDGRRIPVSRRNWDVLFTRYQEYLMLKG